MNLLELYDNDSVYNGHRTEKDDQSTIKLADTRKTPRLTLAQINKLRIANDVRKFEHEKKLTAINKQYAAAAPAEAAPAGV